MKTRKIFLNRSKKKRKNIHNRSVIKGKKVSTKSSFSCLQIKNIQPGYRYFIGGGLNDADIDLLKKLKNNDINLSNLPQNYLFNDNCVKYLDGDNVFVKIIKILTCEIKRDKDVFLIKASFERFKDGKLKELAKLLESEKNISRIVGAELLKNQPKKRSELMQSIKESKAKILEEIRKETEKIFNELMSIRKMNQIINTILRLLKDLIENRPTFDKGPVVTEDSVTKKLNILKFLLIVYFNIVNKRELNKKEETILKCISLIEGLSLFLSHINNTEFEISKNNIIWSNIKNEIVAYLQKGNEKIKKIIKTPVGYNNVTTSEVIFVPNEFIEVNENGEGNSIKLFDLISTLKFEPQLPPMQKTTPDEIKTQKILDAKNFIKNEISAIVKKHIGIFFENDDYITKFLEKYGMIYIEYFEQFASPIDLKKTELKDKKDRIIDDIFKRISNTSLNFKIIENIISLSDFNFGTSYYNGNIYNKIDIKDIYYYGNDSYTTDNIVWNNILTEGYDIDSFLNSTFYSKIMLILANFITIGDNCDPSDYCNLLNLINLLNSAIKFMNEKQNTTVSSMTTNTLLRKTPDNGNIKSTTTATQTKTDAPLKPPVPKRAVPIETRYKPISFSYRKSTIIEIDTVEDYRQEIDEGYFNDFAEQFIRYYNNNKVSLFNNNFNNDFKFLASNYFVTIAKYSENNMSIYKSDYERMLFLLMNRIDFNDEKGIIPILKKKIEDRANEFINKMRTEAGLNISIYWLIAYINFLFDYKLINSMYYFDLLVKIYDTKRNLSNKLATEENEENVTILIGKDGKYNELFLGIAPLSLLDFNELNSTTFPSVVNLNDVKLLQDYKKKGIRASDKDKQIIIDRKRARIECIKNVYNSQKKI